MHGASIGSSGFRNLGLLFLLASGLLASPPGKALDPSSVREAVVLYSGGIQGEMDHCGCRGALGGLARRQGEIERIRQQGPPVFVVDSGDLFHRFPPGHSLRRKDAVARSQVMSSILGRGGLDLVVPGEKDLWSGWPDLRDLIQRGGATLLGANLLLRETRAPALPAFRILERGRVRLGFVGVTSSETQLLGSALARLDRRSGVGPVQEAVRMLRVAGVDGIILVSSQGLSGDRRLLEEVTGIDVVISGRSGEILRRPLMVGGVPLVQAGTRGKYLGRLDLRFPGSGPEISHQVLPLDLEGPVDPQIARQVKSYLENEGSVPIPGFSPVEDTKMLPAR